MSNDPTPQDWERALAKYAVIAPLVCRDLDPEERNAMRKQILAAQHHFPGGRILQVAPRTLREWCQLYRQKNLEGLLSKTRKDKGKPRAIPQEVLDKAMKLREELPSRSAETIADLLDESGAKPIAKSTLNYHFRQAGLKRSTSGEPKAFQRFEHARPNACWQSDMSDGLWLPDPADPQRQRKCYLHAFLDDHSRLIPHAQFYWRESLPALEDCFRQGIAKRGIPSMVYWDNGSAFRSQQLRRMAARLKTEIVFATPYAPEGKGKIERFFGVVKAIFYPEAQAAGITSLEELNRFFWAWLSKHYTRRVHSETKETPLDRWEAGREHVRFASPAEIADTFLWEEERFVRKTGTISLASNHYPVDPALIGQRVIVRFDPFDLSEIRVVQKGHVLAVTRPQELVSRTFSKAQPHVRPEPKTLESSEGFKDRLLSEASEARMSFGDVKGIQDTAHLTTTDLIARLISALGRDLSHGEVQRAQDFWLQHAPFRDETASQALSDAVRAKGADRHLDYYLEAVRSSRRNGRGA